MIGRLQRDLEGLLENAYHVLRRIGDKVDIIEYPTGRRRALDLVCRSRRNIFARVVSDAAELNRSDSIELKASAHAYKAKPIVIARYIYGYETEEDVVYERHGLIIISPEGLENIARDQPIYIVNSHGVYAVRINPKKLRRLREEMGLSLGELAEKLGVSRKAVYEYERGRMNISIDKAVKLLDIFGEEIFEPVDIFEEEAERNFEIINPDTKLEEDIIERLHKMGYKVIHLKRTPIDIVGYKDDETISIVVKHFISERRFSIKVHEADKIIEIAGSKRYIVEGEDDLKILTNK